MMSARYLIVQLADIGDLILSTPALDALRQAQPAAHLTLLTTTHSAPVIPPGLVDSVIPLDRKALTGATAFYRPANLRKILGLRGGGYDAVLFFHHFTIRAGTLKFALIAFASGAPRRIGLENGNGWFLNERLPDGGFGARHQAQYWLDLVGVVGAATAPRPAQVQRAEYSVLNTEKELSVTSDQLIAASHQLRAISYQPPATPPLIVLHAGGGGYSRARRWSPTKFAAVADALVESHGARIVLVGGVNDDASAVRAAMRAPALDLTGQTTLPQLAGLLAQADCFIGAESGVLHLAAASGAPVVAIYGPGNPDAWGPWQPGGRVIVLRSGVACSPCSYVGHGIGLREGCPARTCLKLVTVEAVVGAVGDVLGVHSSQFTVHSGKATSDQRPATSQKADLTEGAEADVKNCVPTGVSSPPLSSLVTRHSSLSPSSAHHPITSSPSSSPPVTRHSSLSPSSPSPITILGLPVHPITYAAWLEQISAWVQESGPARHVCTINPEFVMIARRDPNFWNILQRAALCVPDGVGLLWAARRQGTPLSERVTGSDGVPIIAERAAQTGWRLYLLGAGEGIAQQTADILTARYPGLQIAGVYGGSPAPEEEDAIVERINQGRADILFVAYGAPEQDKWIARNLPRLQVSMAMGVGGAFDFIAGVVPRAPLWMRRIGIEWLYRLYLQPWRIIRMMRLPRFVLAVLMSRSPDG
jgi:exopolysaccharide biosynthesis WecB/TagA/CpsF family protein